MTDGGLAFLVRSLLDCKTKKQAQGVIAQTGDGYLEIAKELLARLMFERTLNQNGLAHKWFSEIGNQTGESADEVKDRAKLDIGCIILCRDDPDYLEFMRASMKDLGREERLKRMKFIPCTSLMNTKQKTEFLDTFERQHRAQGLQLTEPKGSQ